LIKRLFAASLFVFLMLSGCASVFAAGSERPAIELNGADIQAAAYIDRGSIYLPLRAVAEELGYCVQWSGENNPISITNDGKEIMIDLINSKITLNSHAYYIDEGYSGSPVSDSRSIENATYIRGDIISECFSLKVQWDRAGGKIYLISLNENAISVKTVREASEDERIKITLQYPQIDGLSNKTVQNRINSLFKKEAWEARDEGLQAVDEFEKEIASGFTGSPNKYETYFDYKLKYNQNGLLSVVLMDYQYTGGAHGLTVQSSHTLSLETGEEYRLKDLMKGSADYVSLISDFVRKEIDTRVKTGGLMEIGDPPFEAINEDQDFFLSNDAVVIYFQEYEYFPYAAGIQEFPVDYISLENMLKQDFSFLADGVTPSEAKNLLAAVDESLHGSKVAYAAEDGLYCASMDDGRAVLLVKGADISAPVFSSDGNAIAFKQNGALYAYNFSASGERILLKGVDAYCPGQSGGFYASSQKTGIIAINPVTAESVRIVPAQKDILYMDLEPSPDLKLLAYDTFTSSIGNQGSQDSEGTWLFDTRSGKTLMIAKASKMDETSMGDRPVAGKWSPDSGKIIIWLMTQSASLSADGVSLAMYDVAAGKLTELDDGGLAYNENISFAGPNALAFISGGSRTMSENKSISLFDLKKGLSPKTLDIQDRMPTTPCYSTDGKKLAFAAAPGRKTDNNEGFWIPAISKGRQIYMYANGSLTALTNDCAYRSELPVFLRNNNYVVFARVKNGNEKSVWIMDSDGKNKRPLARWKYSDPNDHRFLDFYGSVDWSVMFAVFDNTK